MLLSITFYLLLVTACITTPAQARLQNSEGKIADNAAGIRMKRSPVTLGAAFLKGFIARRDLLAGAKTVQMSWGQTHYKKLGDSKQMIKDFYSVKPINIRDNIIFGKKMGKVGDVGDRTIKYFEHDADLVKQPRITIFRKDQEGNVIKDMIHYKN